MNFGIQYICHLVQIKNDLNRKRRRFYSIMKPTKQFNRANVDGNWIYTEIKSKRKCKSFTKAYATKMYKRTQAEMKAMTAVMREARKEINARYVWSDHGAIREVRFGDTRLNYFQIARLAELYKADAILLGD